MALLLLPRCTVCTRIAAPMAMSGRIPRRPVSPAIAGCLPIRNKLYARTDRTFCTSTSKRSHEVATPTKGDSAPNPSLPRQIPHSKGLLLIHVPVPPSHWPGVIGKSSKLVQALERASAIKGVRCLVVWDGKGRLEGFADGDRAGGEEEQYEVSLWRKDGEVTFTPGVTERIASLPAFGDLLDGKPAESLDGIFSLRSAKAVARDILVCIHGSRDCRCSDLGTPLVRKLKEEIKERRGDERVLECSHVGGHKFAANAIILPEGHLLGNLRDTDAASILDFVKIPKGSSVWDHYRGSFMKTEGEQRDIFAQKGEKM